MRNISTRRAGGRKRKLPKHWWEAKDEAEEARWWDANFERVMEEAIKKGTLRRGSVEEILKEAKRRERGKRGATRQLTLRIPEEVIEAAKREAVRAKAPYQRLMREALTQRFMGKGD
jgi:predicted DNA binding CopG/RHH family protein